MYVRRETLRNRLGTYIHQMKEWSGRLSAIESRNRHEWFALIKPLYINGEKIAEYVWVRCDPYRLMLKGIQVPSQIKFKARVKTYLKGPYSDSPIVKHGLVEACEWKLIKKEDVIVGGADMRSPTRLDDWTYARDISHPTDRRPASYREADTGSTSQGDAQAVARYLGDS